MNNNNNNNEFLPDYKYINSFNGSNFPIPNERNLACVKYIDNMNAHKRLNFSSNLSYFFFILYFPIGILLIMLKLLIFLPLTGILVIITPTCFHTFLTRYIICILYGVWINVKGKPDLKNGRIWAANHLSEIDALAIRACGNPYILGYSFYLQLWWLKLSPLRLLNMVYVPQKSRSEGNSSQRDEIRKQVRHLIENKTNPILVFPEGGLTNGKYGLLQYHKFMFSLNVGIQPIVLKNTRPFPININCEAKGITFFDNVFWFCFIPFQSYTVEFLPIMNINLENGEDELIFSRRVAYTTAKYCNNNNNKSLKKINNKVLATPFLYRDKRKWLKTKHGLQARGIKDINIIIDDEKQLVYVNNIKGNKGTRDKKVMPQKMTNDDKIRNELLMEMNKHWQFSEKQFQHIIMLGTSDEKAGEEEEGSFDIQNDKSTTIMNDNNNNNVKQQPQEEDTNIVKSNEKKVEKTMIVFDIKPFDTETDLEELAITLKKLEINGGTWGVEHQLIPIAFGIKKLRISSIVEDDKVSQDDLEDLINSDGRGDDVIQSIDVFSMSKV